MDLQQPGYERCLSAPDRIYTSIKSGLSCWDGSAGVYSDYLSILAVDLRNHCSEFCGYDRELSSVSVQSRLSNALSRATQLTDTGTFSRWMCEFHCFETYVSCEHGVVSTAYCFIHWLWLSDAAVTVTVVPGWRASLMYNSGFRNCANVTNQYCKGMTEEIFFLSFCCLSSWILL